MDDAPSQSPIDEERLDRWLHGRCALFAVALHRATGLPIRAWIDEDPEIDEPVLVHAFVMDGENALDALGLRDPDDLLGGYETWDPTLVEMTEGQVLAIGEGPDLDVATFAEATFDADLVLAHLRTSRAPAFAP
jgi:hypothetical protein